MEKYEELQDSKEKTVQEEEEEEEEGQGQRNYQTNKIKTNKINK